MDEATTSNIKQHQPTTDAPDDQLGTIYMFAKCIQFGVYNDNTSITSEGNVHIIMFHVLTPESTRRWLSMLSTLIKLMHLSSGKMQIMNYLEVDQM